MVPQNPHASEPRSSDLGNFTADPRVVSEPGNVEESLRNNDVAVEERAAEVVEVVKPSSSPKDPTGLPADESQSAHHEEESTAQMDEYMANLMKRYGMTGVACHAEPKPAVSPVPNPAASAPQQPTPQPTREPAVPPESSRDLANMRELANLNARRAIKKYSTEQLANQALVKLALSSFAMAAALMMAELSLSGHLMLFVVAVVSMIAATLWGVQYLLATRNLLAHLAKQNSPQHTGANTTDKSTSSKAGSALARRLEKLQGNENLTRARDDD